MTTATATMMTGSSIAMATAAAVGYVTAALPSIMLTWRCHGCRRVVAKLQYDGRTVIEVKHSCNAWNRLPDDIAHLRAESGPANCSR